MKVFIGPHHSLIYPYQIVDYLFFWQEKNPSEELAKRWDYTLSDKMGEWLTGTWVNGACAWIESKRHRTVKVKIHDYDSWNVDSTLSVIILPLLKQLQKTKHGSSLVKLEDVPEYMRTTTTEDYDAQSSFKFYDAVDTDNLKHNIHDRWNWVLSEIIWAFEQIQPDNDWEDQYWITHPKLDLTDYPEDEGKDVIPVRWKVKGECDWIGMEKHLERISNGLRLFGVYYRSLWD